MDENSEEYLSRHAHSMRREKRKQRPSLIEEHFEPVSEDEAEENGFAPSDSDADNKRAPR